MADSEIQRRGKKLEAAPFGKGRWDYTNGLYADALIRLSAETGSPGYEKNAANLIGSFIGPTGRIATYEQARPRPASKLRPGQRPPRPVLAKPSLAPKKPRKAEPPKVPYSLDDIQSGVATLKLYDITHLERYRKAAEILRGQLRKHPRIAEGGFWHKAGYPNQMWLDGLYMAGPFYAAYAVRFREPGDFDDIGNQFRLIARHTYDPATGLFYHGWDKSKKMRWANRETGASPSFWSRAIGWYASGLVDVLAVMPKDHPDRPAMVDILRKFAAGITRYQDPATGVWWQVTDMGWRRHNYLEASASCMFTYALAKGINHGFLSRRYIPAVRAAYGGILHQFVVVDKGGKTISLTHCCEVAGLGTKENGTFRYYTHHTKVVSNDLKGIGPFINAGIECQKLLGAESFAR